MGKHSRWSLARHCAQLSLSNRFKRIGSLLFDDEQFADEQESGWNDEHQIMTNWYSLFFRAARFLPQNTFLC